MSLLAPASHAIITDRTGLLGSTGAALAGLPPAAVYGYLIARVLIPVLLIVHAGRGATPTQRMRLVHDYLLGATPRAPRSRSE
jgi:hypothetical protein